MSFSDSIRGYGWMVMLAVLAATGCQRDSAALPPEAGPPPQALPDAFQTPALAIVEGTNLIGNPGFEAGAIDSPTYRWSPNNWAKNDVQFTLDSDHPHSGQYAQRVTMKRILNQPDVQLAMQHLPVKPGMAVQLHFWMRGRTNSLPIQVQFRKGGAPYTTYWDFQIPPEDQWTEYVFNVTLPPKTDPDDTALMFNMKQENTYWLDDVSVVEFPVTDGRPAMTGNLIANGSFEAGRDRWYAEFRESGGKSYSNFEPAVQKNILADITSVAAADAPSGHRVLRFPVFENCAASLTSAYFPMRYNVPAIISFKLKTSAPGRNFHVQLGSGKVPNLTLLGKGFTSPDTDWHTYTFPVTPAPASSGVYFLQLSTASPGEYELDSIRVNEGDQPLGDDQARHFNAGIEPADDTHPANIFYHNDKAMFRLRVENNTPGISPSSPETRNSTASTAAPPLKPETLVPETLPFRGRVVDVWNRTISEFNLAVTLDEQGMGEATFRVPTHLYGGFKCEIDRAAKSSRLMPDAELIYSVVEPLPSPKDAGDSYFGGHVMLTPYNLLIAERAGFRWLRLHPPMPTKWMVIEQEPGKYDFQLEGVRRAHDMGFKLLGSFDTTPDFHAWPDLVTKSGWGNNSLPHDWAAYRRYVVATAKAFSPYIDHWEVWNEPDSSGFLKVPDEKKRAESYVEILRNTRQALDDAGLKLPLVAPAVSHITAKMFKPAVRDGARDLDIVSFHYYNETTGPEEFKPAMTEELAFIRGFKNHADQTPDIWMTEGGVWLASGNSWLRTSQAPRTQVVSVLDAAHSLVRTAVAFKAMGLGKHFHYADFAAPSGRTVCRDECAGLSDVNGIPLPSLAAHAAMVRFLDQAQPLGLRVEKVGDAHVVLARFTRDSRPITVVWSRVPVSLRDAASVLPTGGKLYDMMGNLIRRDDAVLLSLNPIYFVE
ncbi:MAG: carbohydrate binding domain-containing protein [Phycisphaerales bacterium]